MRRYRGRLLVLLAILLTGCNSGYRYSAPDNNYHAVFPEKPTAEQTTVNTSYGPIVVYMAKCSADAGKRQYLSSESVYPYPSSEFDIEKAYGLCAKEAAANNGFDSFDTKTIEHNGITGREVTLTAANGKRSRIHMFFRDDGKHPRLYQTAVTDVRGTVSGAEADAFLLSLDWWTQGTKSDWATP